MTGKTPTELPNRVIELSRVIRGEILTTMKKRKVETILVVMPLLRPTAVTVAILNAMWVWNDFLLPNLVIGQDERYKTIPIVIQMLIGSNGNRDMGAQMAMLVLAIVPIVTFYLFGQKHIIEIGRAHV